MLVTSFTFVPLANEVGAREGRHGRDIKPEPDRGVTFNNVGMEKLRGYTRGIGEGLGGSAWFDYDADGDLDLFLTNSMSRPDIDLVNSTTLFRNNGDGKFIF
ncbi:MAG: FG-GAP repeat domain-containing protein [Nitrospiria bacterium]